MSNWWANKLGAPQAPQPSTPQTTPISNLPSQLPSSQQFNNVPVTANTRLPASATSPDRCPNCASGNYGRSAMAPEAKARCYDCGYPITQSGSGSPGIKTPTGGAVTAARQLNTGNNFNPQTIVDRIG